MTDKTEKSFNQELLDAVEKCSDNLSFEDISRLNGIRLELLRRYIDRQAKNIRNETWDKVYPLLRPYLEGPEPIKAPPPRLGAAYRRHPELVDMRSEQKILLDEFGDQGRGRCDAGKLVFPLNKINKIADPVEKCSGLAVLAITIGVKKQIELEAFGTKPLQICCLLLLKLKGS